MLTRRQWERGTALLPPLAAVAATYVYFLLFAQFAFLDRLTEQLDTAHVQLAMGAMGVAGLIASLVVGFWPSSRPQRRLAFGFLLAGLCAAITPFVSGLAPLVLMAIAIGASTALVSVTLALRLPGWVGDRLGPVAGAGTALAYLLCNLPGVFDASSTRRAAFAAVACASGLVASRRELAPAPGPERSGSTFPALPIVGLVIAFLALVWLDSAVFAVVQRSGSLGEATWGSPGRSLTQGLFHAAAALIAGWALGRGALRVVLAASFVLFAVSFSWLTPQAPLLWLAGPLYAIGISFYSVALVVAPALGRGLDLPRRAALLFGISGWVGSALGVGMALNLGHVPRAFVALAGGAVVLVIVPLGRVRRGLETWVPAALALAVVALMSLSPPEPAAEPLVDSVVESPSTPMQRGRLVYIAEGCINCHSQLVRPLVADARYGPARPLDRSERPPLVGLRRQGPDLSNVGLRRQPEWLRAHLISPRALVPHSTMPSYDHLFAASDSRGEDLVEYLGSLRPPAVAGAAP